MKKKGNATIVDIAHMAQVTNITVSRAFNKPELVKPETRERILNIAKELNYVPNAFARNLKSNQSQIIGLVTSSTFSPVYAEILKKLCQMADERGYMVMIFETGGSETAENRAVQTLFSYKASGILLSVVSDREGYTPPYLQLASEYQIPIVLFDRDIQGTNLPGVFLNNVEIGVRAGKYLAKKQHQSYLICGGPQDSEITQDRISGLLGGLRMKQDRVDILNGSYLFEEAYECILSYLQKQNTFPDCIIGINGAISMAVLKVLKELSISHIDLFSIDEVPYSDIYDVKIPCIAHHPQGWGEQVGTLMFDIINGKKSRTERIYIESILVE